MVKSLSKKRCCEKNAMQMPPPQAYAFVRQLLWHCLMGIALGVFCGGLLLQIGASHPEALMRADTIAARLWFLLTIAFFFGVGATLTGATFLANDNERSQSK